VNDVQAQLAALRQRLESLESLRDVLGDETLERVKAGLLEQIQALLEGESHTGVEIHTGGGAVILGDVHTDGGGFVGRDAIQHPPAGTATPGEAREPASRLADLEARIRESYAIVSAYETVIQTSNRPEEKARARRLVGEQWSHIQGYVAEYRPLVGDSLPPDIAEIAARFMGPG
jgi:hypothetical protein